MENQVEGCGWFVHPLNKRRGVLYTLEPNPLLSTEERTVDVWNWVGIAPVPGRGSRRYSKAVRTPSPGVCCPRMSGEEEKEQMFL